MTSGLTAVRTTPTLVRENVLKPAIRLIVQMGVVTIDHREVVGEILLREEFR